MTTWKQWFLFPTRSLCLHVTSILLKMQKMWIIFLHVFIHLFMRMSVQAKFSMCTRNLLFWKIITWLHYVEVCQTYTEVMSHNWLSGERAPFLPEEQKTKTHSCLTCTHHRVQNIRPIETTNWNRFWSILVSCRSYF